MMWAAYQCEYADTCCASTFETYWVAAVFDSEDAAKVWAKANLKDNRETDGIYHREKVWWEVDQVPFNPTKEVRDVCSG